MDMTTIGTRDMVTTQNALLNAFFDALAFPADSYYLNHFAPNTD